MCSVGRLKEGEFIKRTGKKEGGRGRGGRKEGEIKRAIACGVFFFVSLP